MTTTLKQSQRLDAARRPSNAPLLSSEQVGHIRHIDNLSRLPRGDWRHMQGRLPFQEDFSAYRYQLGYMSLAIALAHFHQLPAAPVVFKGTLDRLIQKMLEPDVWAYWRDTSTAGGYGPVTLPRLESRTDPVAVDNIMYSAYLQVMTLMYTTLFGDRKYEETGSLSFPLRPILWGKDRHETFNYDQRSLNERIYWNMVENGYLGVACEPFCVFQMCNQIPILGFRLHDHLYGGQTANEVTAGYLKAWEDFGSGLNKNGHFVTHLIQQNELLPKTIMVDRDAAWTDGWLGMLLNMWRPELVRSTYDAKMEGWLKRAEDGTISVARMSHIPGSEDLVEAGTLGEIGWLAGWASEMGDNEVVTGLLRHADKYMQPHWENGGLYYPRRDETYDEDGHLVGMIPTASNAMFPYARLNVQDGLRSLYQRPWSEADRMTPALSGLSEHVNVHRAWYHNDTQHLQLSVAPMRGISSTPAELTIDRVWSRGDFSLALNGVVLGRGIDGAVEKTTSADNLAVDRTDDSLRISLPLSTQSDIDIVWGRE